MAISKPPLDHVQKVSSDESLRDQAVAQQPAQDLDNALPSITRKQELDPQKFIKVAPSISQDPLFDSLILRMNQHQKLVPLKIKSDIQGFRDRVVVLQRQKVCIGTLSLFIEISFLKNNCCILGVEP